MSEETEVKTEETPEPIPFPTPDAADPVDEPGRAATDEEAAQVEEVPEAEGTEPTEAEVPAPPAAVHIAQKARIQWLDEDGNPKEEDDSEDCWRSLAALFVHLGRLAESKERALDSKLRITLLITDAEGSPSTVTNSQGEERSEVVLFEDGTLVEALEHFAGVAMPPPVAYAKVQGAVAQISEMSTLKAAIITLVFDDAKPAGMVFMSDSVEVTENDLIIAGTSAEHFVEQYKKAMRAERGLEFPGDSPIIVPGPGMVPPGGLR